MKKILIVIIITVFWIIDANAQNDSIKYVNFILPSNAVRISKNNLNLNNEQEAAIQFYYNLYKIGNFNLGVNEVFRKYYSPYFLDQLKKWSINFLNQSVGLIDELEYTSRIEYINYNKVLISQKKEDNYFRYNMRIINENNTMAFNAVITFANESDKAAATQLMYDFLNSIEFENPINVPCSITASSCSRGEYFRDCGCHDKPSNPCLIVKKNDERATNTIVQSQITELKKITTFKQYGAEQNITTFPFDSTPEYKNIPIRSDATTNRFVPQFTWNPTDGYTTGIVLNHPDQTGPTVSEIVSVYDYFSNEDLLEGGSQSINFFKENFTTTIVTKNEIFILHIIDWSALERYHTEYKNDKRKLLMAFEQKIEEFISRKENVEIGKLEYESTIYAAFSLFGNAISIAKLDKESSKFVPLMLDTRGKIKIANQTCNN